MLFIIKYFKNMIKKCVLRLNIKYFYTFLQYYSVENVSILIVYS